MITRHIVGCMSGTSLDAIDAALVRVEGVGLELRATPLAFASVPLGDLTGPLRSFTQQTPMTSRAIAELSREFSLRHVDAIRRAIGDRRPDLIAVHGQTVYHAPPVSWQLLTPAVIAAAFGVPLVCDVRAADLARGGQGAPLTPIADFVLFRAESESRVVLNLGGFANFTWLPPGRETTDACLARIRGGDLCACNQLLDGLALQKFGRAFDADGKVAETGRIVPSLHGRLCELLRTPRDGRSLGTTDEPHAQIRSLGAENPPADVLATACDAVATTIAAGVPFADSWLLAGGGAKNLFLAACIRRHVNSTVRMTDDLGVPVEQREAIEFAVLGTLCQDGVAISLPQITGCRAPAPISGVWILPNKA